MAPETAAPAADREALVRVGEMVRERLAADPGAWKVPTDKAEIFAIADFLSASECARMIELVDRTAKPSGVFAPDYAGSYRTSFSGDVDSSDPFVRMVERRIDDLLGLDHAWGETVQGQRYQVGQQFKAHCDWFWTLGDYWPAEEASGGQRSWTAMAYLNAVEEGGTTDFTRLGISIPPQPGALLIWNNATPEGMVNWDTMHAAQPVVSGVKYVITKWYRTRQWG